MNYAMRVVHDILCALLSTSVGLSWMSLLTWDYMTLCWLLPFLDLLGLGCKWVELFLSVLLYVFAILPKELGAYTLVPN